MDALVGQRRWKWRETDWTAAAVSGFAAGAVLMVLDLVWSALFNAGGPWQTSHMIAPIFTGAHNLPSSSYQFSLGVVAVALVIHYALGIVFGLIMAAVLVQLRLDSSPGIATVAGASMGCALYLINFDLLTVFFPWLISLRGVATVAAHVVFGVVAALLYCRLKRVAPER